MSWFDNLDTTHSSGTDVIFNKKGLEEYTKKIKTTVRDNYKIFSLMDIYNASNLDQNSEQYKIKNYLDSKGYENKKFNYNVLVNESYTQSLNRYLLFKITDYINLTTGDTIGAVSFTRNDISTPIFVKGFTQNGFDNDKTNFTILDLNARDIALSGELTYSGNTTLKILSTIEAARKSLIQNYRDVTKNIDKVYVKNPEKVIIKNTHNMNVTITTGSYWDPTKTVSTTVTLGTLTGTIRDLVDNKWVAPTSYYYSADSFTFTAVTVNTVMGDNSYVGKCSVDSKDYYKILTATELTNFWKSKILFRNVDSGDNTVRELSLPISNDNILHPLFKKLGEDNYERYLSNTYYDDFSLETPNMIWAPEDNVYLVIGTPPGRPGRSILPNGIDDTIDKYASKKLYNPTNNNYKDSISWGDLLSGSIITAGGISAAKSIMGYKVYGAVFNDYAEFRHTEKAKPGMCVVEDGKGGLAPSEKRLLLGANIVSDTYGFSIGETIYADTPIAVCGRVLAYTFEHRELFKPGEAVCSGPNGTISKMTREEIRNWPDAIVGYVSEIPDYEEWGSDNVKVDGRIWIKVN